MSLERTGSDGLLGYTTLVCLGRYLKVGRCGNVYDKVEGLYEERRTVWTVFVQS